LRDAITHSQTVLSSETGTFGHAPYAAAGIGDVADMRCNPLGPRSRGRFWLTARTPPRSPAATPAPRQRRSCRRPGRESRRGRVVPSSGLLSLMSLIFLETCIVGRTCQIPPLVLEPRGVVYLGESQRGLSESPGGPWDEFARWWPWNHPDVHEIIIILGLGPTQVLQQWSFQAWHVLLPSVKPDCSGLLRIPRRLSPHIVRRDPFKERLCEGVALRALEVEHVKGAT